MKQYFYLKQMFCICFPSTHVFVWVAYSFSSTNYLGVPNSAQWTYNWKFLLIITLCEFK